MNKWFIGFGLDWIRENAKPILIALIIIKNDHGLVVQSKNATLFITNANVCLRIYSIEFQIIEWNNLYYFQHI